jgi:putative sigma-54 modulation protein
MKLKITSKGLKITDGIRNNLDNRIKKILHGLNEIISIHVFLSIQKKRHIAEATIVSKGNSLHFTDVTGDLYMSIDGVLKKIEKHLKKIKDRRQGLKIKNALAAKSIVEAQSDILIKV